MKRLVRKHFLWFYEKMDKDAIDAYAAQASVGILSAFLPFLLCLLPLSQLSRFEDTTLLFAFANVMPSPVGEMLRMLFSEIRAPEGILSMTAIICVWSASASMLALVKGLYAVFDVPKRNYIFMRALAIVYTLALAIILLVSIGLLVFGDMLYDWLVDYMPPSFPRIINEFKPLMAFLILLLFFWLMFIAIPRRQVS